jgi:hypothetical protein
MRRVVVLHVRVKGHVRVKNRARNRGHRLRRGIVVHVDVKGAPRNTLQGDHARLTTNPREERKTALGGDGMTQKATVKGAVFIQHDMTRDRCVQLDHTLG